MLKRGVCLKSYTFQAAESCLELMEIQNLELSLGFRHLNSAFQNSWRKHHSLPPMWSNHSLIMLLFKVPGFCACLWITHCLEETVSELYRNFTVLRTQTGIQDFLLPIDYFVIASLTWSNDSWIVFYTVAPQETGWWIHPSRILDNMAFMAFCWKMDDVDWIIVGGGENWNLSLTFWDSTLATTLLC